MAKPSGILGVNHVAVHTSRIEEGEGLYADLFGADVQYRAGQYGGEWVAIDAKEGWDAIRRTRRLSVHVSLVRAGPLTIALIDEPTGRAGPLGHVCLTVTDQMQKLIRERAKALELREIPGEPGGFRFRDRLGVIWEIAREREAFHRPERRLDLGTGRVD